MSFLIAGVVLFVLMHAFPSVAPTARRNLITRLGEKGYSGVFALLVVTSIVLIVYGWKHAVPTHVYMPPLTPGIAISGLVLVAFILFIASQAPTNIRRLMRHPQLTGVILWGTAHLLSNGDSRSLVLFGGVTAWAIAIIPLINRREGPWIKREPVGLIKDVVTIILGLAVFGAFAWFHQSLFGVSAAPGP